MAPVKLYDSPREVYDDSWGCMMDQIDFGMVYDGIESEADQ